ncbi:sulfotransferase [Sphingomonas sp. SUN019]|uniref:sulfotransferase family protein n=1 Tax=Sphingomonas sp. SUN019 TaxID=2937788 RepID=UPI00216411AD|nr:sulfotransferase [Sphingomonas sp. SUN019]UVO52270.1 sulfotransferase [Sphingomonas sp. SUN019]
MSEQAARAQFDRPVFIVSSPRAGSSMLFLSLAQAPGAFTIGGESHQLIEGVPGLHPFQRGWTSNRLTAEDATAPIAEELARRFHANLRDRDGVAPTGRVRLIEKTPKNSLRVPFLDRIFPDAQFVYLYRDPRETLASMIEAWTSGRFRTYPRLPGWRGLPWSLLLTPGWRDLNGLALPEIVARQWAATTDVLLADLAMLAPGRVHAIDYAAVTATPAKAMRALANAVGLVWDRAVATLPLSPTVVSVPRADKWRDRAEEIEGVLPVIAEPAAAARAILGRHDVVQER